MGGHVNTVWTDEQSEVLITLLAQGKSFSEIASLLNEQFNTTYSRNAACGKGFRLRIKAPKKAKAVRKPRKRIPVTLTIKPLPRIEAIRLRCTEIKTQNVTLLELDPNGCRYPSGDNSFTFCNHQQQFGSSYCPAHEALCHGAAPKVSADERLRRRLHWKKLQKLNSIFPLEAAQ